MVFLVLNLHRNNKGRLGGRETGGREAGERTAQGQDREVMGTARRAGNGLVRAVDESPGGRWVDQRTGLVCRTDVTVSGTQVTTRVT